MDAHAVDAAIENAGVNKLDMSKYRVETGDIITDEAFRKSMGEKKYDIVVANILADIIIPLSAVIKKTI